MKKNKSFYKLLEDKHRGDRDLIKNRLKVYLECIMPLKKITSHPKALDLGCGRGEWLELLGENGFDAEGIDLEDDMIAFCREKNFSVHKKDAIEYLRTIPKETFDLVSGFHIVEHLKFERLQELIALSFKVLKKGGLLIFETPNPENILVSSTLFYMDPTHKKLLPPDLLTLMAEYQGFDKVKVLRLQEQKNILQKELTISDVLKGVSPDYSVLAQKLSSKDTSALFRDCFEKDYGVSLNNILTKYEEQTQNYHQYIVNKLDMITDQLQKEKDELWRQKEGLQKEKEIANAQMEDLLNSKSWKLTKPLRLTMKDLKYIVKKILLFSEKEIQKHPKLKDYIKTNLIKYPNLYGKLKNLKNNNINESTNTAETILAFSPLEELFYYKLSQKSHENRPAKNFTKDTKEKLAYFSPLPFQKSGISQYSMILLEELKNYYDIVLIIEDFDAVDEKILKEYKTDSVENFLDKTYEYERVIYHIGNSGFHSYMFDALKVKPGIVVLHDFYLSHVLQSISISFVDELYKSHGYGAIHNFSMLKDKNSYDEIVWKYPCNLEVLQNAQSVIVHSNHSKELAKDFYVGNLENWYKVPLLRKEAEFINKKEAKKKLSIPQDTFVICSFGQIGETKLSYEILKAYKEFLSMQTENLLLVFVGANYLDGYGNKIVKFIKRQNLQNSVRITDWVDEDIFEAYLSVSDIAIQLRTKSRGETSAAVLDCMNYGIATIVNAHGSMKDLPHDRLLMVEDKFTTDSLTKAIKELHGDTKKRKEIGKNAKELLKNVYNPKKCVQEYFEIIEKSYKYKELPTPSFTDEKSLRNIANQFANTIEPDIRQKQILVDVSTIVRLDLKTGIQRVIRSQLIELIKNAPKNVRIEPVYQLYIEGKFKYMYAKNYMSKLLNLENFTAQDRPVDVFDGDIFYGLDLAREEVSNALESGLFEKYKTKGVKIVFMVYDLLPISNPEFFPPEQESLHIKWLDEITDVCDKLICISDAVAKEVDKWIQINKTEKYNEIAVTSVHLGAELNAPATPENLTLTEQQQLKQFNDNAVTFLMVGTVEPRKGHMQVLKAFELLWGENLDVNLLIVGKKGWMVENIIDKISKNRQLNKHLFWMESASDTFLQQLYIKSDALIAASQGEGFGLPIIEAAHYDLSIIARDIPVFREVARENAFYFTNTLDEVILASVIKDWLLLYKDKQNPTSNSLEFITWKDNALQTLQELE